jgi:hypothetical protein
MNAALWLNGAEAECPRLIEFAEEFAGRCELPAGERARLLIILEELFIRRPLRLSERRVPSPD